MIAALVFLGLGLVAWLVWEAIKAPTVDDWHDECIKARENDKVQNQERSQG